MTPRATIVILSHRPRLVGRALASALAQTVPCQILVQHAADAWVGKFNEIAAAARGEFIIPLCDDDLLHPRYVERCLTFANDGDVIFADRRMWWSGFVEWTNWRSFVRRVPALGHHHHMFGAKLAGFIREKGGEAIRVDIQPESFMFGSPLPMTCCIRRSWWEQLGGYDDIPHCDTELWYRLVKGGARVVYVPEPLFQYRFHRAQYSREQPSNGAAALAFHRKHFMDFGVAWTPNPDNAQLMDATIIPEGERAEYVRRHGMRVA